MKRRSRIRLPKLQNYSNDDLPKPNLAQQVTNKIKITLTNIFIGSQKMFPTRKKRIYSPVHYGFTDDDLAEIID